MYRLLTLMAILLVLSCSKKKEEDKITVPDPQPRYIDGLVGKWRGRISKTVKSNYAVVSDTTFATFTIAKASDTTLLITNQENITCLLQQSPIIFNNVRWYFMGGGGGINYTISPHESIVKNDSASLPARLTFIYEEKQTDTADDIITIQDLGEIDGFARQ